MPPLISVVSPVYKGEASVGLLVSKLISALSSITDKYEIILVDDGSPDNGWKEIEKQCALDPKVIGLKLSRNFGQHHAILAGLKHAKGDWVVVIDCDLQDDPAEIPLLYAKAKEGYNIVVAGRINRKDSALKRLTSTLFYKTYNYLTDSKQDSTVANFGIYSRQVIDTINSFTEPVTSFPILISWIGYSKCILPVQHKDRAAGESSYNWIRLIKLATKIILSHSDKPLRLLVYAGFVVTFTSFLFILIFLGMYLSGITTVAGYTSLILSIWFIGGILMLCTGVLGLYLGRSFEAIKNRPKFIIEEKKNI